MQNASSSIDSGSDGDDFSIEQFAKHLGPEIYPGEITDRVRLAAITTLSSSDSIGLDDRSRVVLQKLFDRLPASAALRELRDDIKRATKDPKRLGKEVTSLLERHGYRKKSDNRHIRLEAKNGFDGLASITVPKTPGERRGLKNQRSQIEGTLGLTKLPD